MTPRGVDAEAMARRVARDIPEGAYVNLGIGLPTRIAAHVSTAVFHSENGILGVTPLDGEPDPDLINASKEPVGLATGGAYFDHATSFAMIRGGYIDVTVMGAFQVSAAGDLANWSTGEIVPAVGGAMDLAAGARRVFAMMRHVTRDGAPKLVGSCTYPLTAAGVVERVYTDLAVLRVEAGRFVVEELAPGVDAGQLQQLTAAPLTFADAVGIYGEAPVA